MEEFFTEWSVFANDAMQQHTECFQLTDVYIKSFTDEEWIWLSIEFIWVCICVHVYKSCLTQLKLFAIYTGIWMDGVYDVLLLPSIIILKTTWFRFSQFEYDNPTAWMQIIESTWGFR